METEAQWVEVEVDNSNDEFFRQKGIDPNQVRLNSNVMRVVAPLGINTGINLALGDDIGRATGTALAQTATGRLLGELAYRSVDPLKYHQSPVKLAMARGQRHLPSALVGNYLGGWLYDRVFPENLEAAQAQQIIDQHNAYMNGNRVNSYLVNA
jgi:hypothetical protein